MNEQGDKKMTPTFPPTRYYDNFVKNTELETNLIQKLFKLQCKCNIKELTVEEIKACIEKMEEEKN